MESGLGAAGFVHVRAPHPTPLTVIGDFVIPPVGGPPSRDFQTLHFDFGLPLVPVLPADVARFTTLYMRADTPASDAVTRLAPIRALVALRRWVDRDELVRRLAGYGRSHGAWDDAAGYVEGSLARIIEAVLDEPAVLPSLKRDPGFLCGTEFATLAAEVEFFAQRSLRLETVEIEVSLRPGELLVLDNLSVAHGRRGTRRPGELNQRVFGHSALSVDGQLRLRDRVLDAFSEHGGGVRAANEETPDDSEVLPYRQPRQPRQPRRPTPPDASALGADRGQVTWLRTQGPRRPSTDAGDRRADIVERVSSGRLSVPRENEPGGTFGVARQRWLGSLGNVRNVVRQEMIARQLDRHLPPRPVRVLDVGAGQGTQSLRLARAGHHVLAIEPEAHMRAAFQAALVSERAEVQARVALHDGRIGQLAAVTGDDVYDTVLLLGVLMYLPASQPVVSELAAHVAPGGFLALAIRTTTSALWRPAARQDWQAALVAFDELDEARRDRRDMRYMNEIGTPARADDLESVTSYAATLGLSVDNWYGVRIAVDPDELDPEPPGDPAELEALLEVEERLGATDPYRRLGQLAHLILRRTPPA